MAEAGDGNIKTVTDGIPPDLDGNSKILFPEMKNSLSVQQAKWLPDKCQAKSISIEVDEFLNLINGKIRLLHCHYNGSMLVSKTSFTENQLHG